MVSLYDRVLAANYYLNALSLSNGSLLWSNPTGVGPYPSMASDGRMVFMGSNGGGLVVFDPLTGKAITTMNQVMALGSAAICGNVAFVSSVAGLAYPRSPTGSLLAVNVTTGRTLWDVNLTVGQFEGFPVTDGRLVYSTITNNTLLAYSAGTGQPVWSKAFAQNLTSAPPIWRGELLVSTVDGRVFALNATSGNAVWSTKVNGTIEDIRSSAAVGYGEVFLGTSGGMYALNATSGSVLWRAGAEGTTLGTPTIVDGVVFIADQGGNLYEFNASNGALLWTYSGLGVGYVSEPIVTDGLVVVDGNNGIFAFR
jgi:outer membrane protein assembly factor BamB